VTGRKHRVSGTAAIVRAGIPCVAMFADAFAKKNKSTSPITAFGNYRYISR
jgi:hypothetical protein